MMCGEGSVVGKGGVMGALLLIHSAHDEFIHIYCVGICVYV